MHKSTENEKSINNVFAYQDKELVELKEKNSNIKLSEMNQSIQESEDLLRMIGKSVPQKSARVDRTKKVITIPSWESLVQNAELSVGKANHL